MKRYTVREAAELLGYTPRRIQQMCSNGLIPGAVKEGRSWVIYADSDSGIDMPDHIGYAGRSRIKYVQFRGLPANPPVPVNADPFAPMFVHEADTPSQAKLPIGISSYVEASCDYYYVDKTLFIRDLIDRGAKVSLFTRPRRFGKTLNISMLQCFFEKTDTDTSVYFRNKKIWRCGDRYRNEQGRYPVITLSFKDAVFTTWSEQLAYIKMLLSEEYGRHYELADSPLLSEPDKEFYYSIASKTASADDYVHSIRKLASMLRAHYGQNVVLLIDEYDTPIQTAFSNGFYDECIAFMRVLLSSVLKDNTDLERAVLTGILRVAKESIFSGLNNLRVYTVADDQFSEYFGFTKSETRSMLEAYGRADKYEEVCEWYDGYLFGNTAILNPWSVINYLDNECRSLPYWVNTSSNDLIGELLAAAGPDIRRNLIDLLNGGQVEAAIDTSVVYPEVHRDPQSIYSFLLVTGYLRMTGLYLTPMGGYLCGLAIPNREISVVYRREIINRMMPSGSSSVSLDVEIAFHNNNPDLLTSAIERYLASSASYYDTTGESFYHGLMLGLFAIISDRYIIRSNRESGNGRFDIQLHPKYQAMPGYIFEFKYSPDDGKDMDALASKAVEQIKGKNYAADMQSSDINQIIAIGAAFRGKKISLHTERLL